MTVETTAGSVALIAGSPKQAFAERAIDVGFALARLLQDVRIPVAVAQTVPSLSSESADFGAGSGGD